MNKDKFNLKEGDIQPVIPVIKRPVLPVPKQVELEMNKAGIFIIDDSEANQIYEVN